MMISDLAAEYGRQRKGFFGEIKGPIENLGFNFFYKDFCRRWDGKKEI